MFKSQTHGLSVRTFLNIVWSKRRHSFTHYHSTTDWSRFLKSLSCWVLETNIPPMGPTHHRGRSQPSSQPEPTHNFGFASHISLKWGVSGLAELLEVLRVGARFERILLELSGGEGSLLWTHIHSPAACSSTCSMGGGESSLEKAFATRPCSQTCILPNTNMTGDISGRGSRQALKRTFIFIVTLLKIQLMTSARELILS